MRAVVAGDRRPGPLAALVVLLAALAVLLGGCTTTSNPSVRGSSGSSGSSGGSSGVGSGLEPGTKDPTSGLDVVALSSLPKEATTTVRLIQSDGPFPYSRDGVTYHNANRVLPKHPDGYYHEYTVKTPGAKNRGARRVIHGSGTEYYYTGDHYNTFQRIA